MPAIDILINYISRSSIITLFVLIWLSFYFITTFGVLISKYFYLDQWLKIERNSLESMLCKNVAQKNSTNGLWLLSMIASTSPFIGLFGTVVSILDTFSGLGQSGSASLGVIAPAISEALVATAAGIFVAIPAYSSHLFIKRKAYEVIMCVERESELILSNISKENKGQKSDV